MGLETAKPVRQGQTLAGAEAASPIRAVMQSTVTAAVAERSRPSVIDVMVTRDPAHMLPAVDNRAVKVKAGDRVA